MLFLGLTAIFALAACDPCRSLADKICECKTLPGERESCLRSLDLFPHMSGFSFANDPELCREVLERNSCNCSAILDGLVENCGMTR